MSAVLPAKLSVPDDVLAQELNGEVVLLNMDNEYYYSLNRVGSTIWQLIAEKGDVEAVLPDLLTLFPLDKDSLRQDVTDLVKKLLKEGLLVASSA